MDTYGPKKIKQISKELRPGFTGKLIKVVDKDGNQVNGATWDNIMDFPGRYSFRYYIECQYCGKEYSALLSNLLRRKVSGCHHCSKYQLSRAEVNEFNSFHAKHKEIYGCEPENFKVLEPGLATMGATAKTISYGSRWKIQINCARCHATLKTTPHDALRTEGCPNCKVAGRSKPEKILQKLLKKRLGDAVLLNTAADIDMLGRKTDCDCVINGIEGAEPVVIQYDGYFFHKDKADKDLWVNERCYDAGYNVIRMRGNGLTPLPERDRLYQIATPSESLMASSALARFLDSLNEVFNIMNSLGYSLTLVSMDELKETAAEARTDERSIRPSLKKWLAAYDFYVANGGKVPMPKSATVFFEGKLIKLKNRFNTFVYRVVLNEFEKAEFEKRGLRTWKIHCGHNTQAERIVKLAREHSVPEQKINSAWMSQFNRLQHGAMVKGIKEDYENINLQNYAELLSVNFYMTNDISLKDWLFINRPEKYAEVMAFVESSGYSLPQTSIDEFGTDVIRRKNSKKKLKACLNENTVRENLAELFEAYDDYVKNGGVLPLPRRIKYSYKGKVIDLQRRFEYYSCKTDINEVEKEEFKKRNISIDRRKLISHKYKIELIKKVVEENTNDGLKINYAWLKSFGLHRYYEGIVKAIHKNTLASQEYGGLIEMNFYMTKDVPLKDWLLQNRPEQYAEVMALIAKTAA